MLNRVFKNNLTIQLILMIPLWIYISIVLFHYDFAQIPNYEMSHLFNFIAKLLENHTNIGKIIILLQLLFQTIFLSLTLQKHELIENNSYLPSFIFTLFIIAFPQHLSFSPIHFSNTFILLLFSKTLTTHEEEYAGNSLFTCALYAALSILFFAPNIVFTISLLISIFIFSNVSIKSIVAIIFGLILPYIYIFSYYYLTDTFDNLFDFYQVTLSRKFFIKIPNNSIFQIFYFTSFGIFFIMGLKLFSSSSEKLIRIRKKHQFIIQFTLFSFLGILLSNYSMTHQIGIIFIGMTSILSIMIDESKKILMSEITIWTIIIFCFILHFFQLFI